MRINTRFGLALLGIIGLAVASPARAGKNVVMTPSTVTSALAALQPGDTLTLEGTFSSQLNLANRDFGGVQVNARGATLLQGMKLTNVHNIAFSGGTYGMTSALTSAWYTVDISNVSNFSLSGASIVGSGATNRSGLRIDSGSFVTLRDNQVSGFVFGMHVGGIRDSLITNNHFNNQREDGLRLINSTRVIISENRCTNFTPHSTAHPDCIQMWSSGNFLQSDIFVLNNYAAGAMQAFVSFDPKTGSGTRMTFAGNYAAVTRIHGVSCYGCSDSVFVDNIFVTPFGSQHGVGLRTPDGVNNLAADNQWFDFRNNAQGIFPEHVFSDLVPTLAGLVGSIHASRAHTSRLSFASLALDGDEPVPEPATWLLMMLGFALVGRQLRRVSGPAHVLA